MVGLGIGLLGLAAGAGTGFGMTREILPWFDRYRMEIGDNLLIPLMLHGVVWGSLGAVGGLAFGLAHGPYKRGFNLLRPVVGGIVGAWLATVAFEFLGAIALPMAGTTQPYPTTRFARLLCVLTLSVLASAGVAWTIRCVEVVPRPASGVVVRPGEGAGISESVA